MSEDNMILSFKKDQLCKTKKNYLHSGCPYSAKKMKLHPLTQIMMTALVFRSIDSSEKDGEEIDTENCKNCKNSGQNFYKC